MKIVFNGVEYDSVEAMPPEEREAWRTVMNKLADRDGDGTTSVPRSPAVKRPCWTLLVNALLLLLVSGVAQAERVRAESTPRPRCPGAPYGPEIRLARGALEWLPDSDLTGPCEEVPEDGWIRKAAGAADLLVHADGPSGSGRFWTVTIAVANRGSKPSQGVCLSASTLGWRTLQRHKKAPLPWLEDLDGDGRAELIIWSGFGLPEGESLADTGLIAWVYRLKGLDRLALDWKLTRMMAREIASSYRERIEDPTGTLHERRASAATILESFARGDCIRRRGR